MKKGDIIRIQEEIFLPQINAKKWFKNFGFVNRLAVLTENPTNNGNVRIMYSDGKIRWFNIITDTCEVVKGA